jgi:hypothetical protein
VKKAILKIKKSLKAAITLVVGILAILLDFWVAKT